MTREEAKIFLLQLHTDKQLNKSEHEALRIAIKTLEREPCREADDYENEISDLYNHLDIVEYDKERLREEVTTLEEKLKGLFAEPCDDFISRQAVLEAVSKIGLCKCNTNEIEAVDECLRVVKALPPVTPQLKTGHWDTRNIFPNWLYCSECDEPYGGNDRPRYCPNCGCAMKGELE